MAIQFKEMQQQEQIIGQLLQKHHKISDEIKIYSNTDADVILQMAKDLQKNWDDFTRQERKLNIAVIGRVKAGKSTFLNTIIFNGKHVLPEAFTPKTATLTKIEYAENNSLEVEYYSSEEWKGIEQQAKSSDKSESVKAAKELTESVKSSRIDVSAILSKGEETETFSSENDLMGRLNRYVGENGEITPLVKCVTLKINKPELEGISLVDTPGLNDPVISRTQKTRDFLGKCDVVFFLSPASQFLDKNDVDLLRAQLPQKGVARLILICSRFDDALVDAIYDVDSLEEAVDEVKTALTEQAKSIFTKQSLIYGQAGNDTIATLLKECETPIFVSSLFHNMIDKSSSDYNAAESNAFDNLNEHDDLDQDMMAVVGDITPVENRMNEVIKTKDAMLVKKAQNFVPLATNNLTQNIMSFKAAAVHKLNQVETGDKDKLEKQQRVLLTKINTIQSKLEEYFGMVTVKMDRVKIDMVQDLRETIKGYSSVRTQSRTEMISHRHRVSDSKLWNPFSWGDHHYEYTYSYNTYSFIDVNDALENIRNYGYQASTDIENTFIENADISDLKPKLLRVVVDNIDSSDESYDPAYFRLLTERTLSQIRLPVMNLDVSDFIGSLSYYGSQVQEHQISQFRQQFSNTMSSMLESITVQFSNEVDKFIEQLNNAKDAFANNLLKNINDDFEEIKTALAERERASERLKDYITALEVLEKQ